ncbi:excinuclease ABC subunit UvrC [Chloroflexota bacterium]
MASNLVTEQLRQLTAGPGVYLLKDAEGTILYVGKAANLHNRVRSYFSGGYNLSPKLQRMVARVDEVDFFVTNSEQEALVLELNMIKRYRPRYNVRLKDDKSFPYLKVELNKEWPRVFVTRYLEEDGGRYFGPFASARSIRQAVKVIKDIFPFRSCTKTIDGKAARPCLEYHIQHCVGPCIGATTREEYADVIKQVVLFLEGKEEVVARELESKMRKAADALEFEKAALYRDQIEAIDNVIQSQRVATRVKGEQDVIAFAQDRDEAYVQVFLIRNSRLTGRESFVLRGTRDEGPAQIMTGFIKQFYASNPSIPQLILLQHAVEDVSTIRSWLQSKRGGVVRLEVPRRGVKKKLVETVSENARQGLEQLRIKQLATPTSLAAALAEVQRELELPRLPSRMEAYDISNIQGKAAVGSMVVFEQGRPKPSHYRRFKIKTVSGVDDYAMLQEVLRRRLRRGVFKQDGTAWAILPDLILVDGGKGQLSAARAAMEEIGAESVPVASLAKENEEIFVPQKSAPVVLPRSSPGLQLLQRLRDEAHRFAISYHQRVRKKSAFASALDVIPGIGPRRKRALMKHFGSVRAINEATEEELAAVKGMNKSAARKIKEYL